MSEPLACASFEFSLDDLADVSCRLARRLPSHRRLRVQATILSGVMAGLVIYALTLIQDPMPWLPRAGVSLAAALLAMWICHERWEPYVRRSTRRVLRDMYGEGPHRCDVELHTEHFTVKQFLTIVTTPWSQVDSVNDDQGDIEILASKGGSVVVNASAFAGQAEQARFLDTVITLLNRAQPAPTS